MYRPLSLGLALCILLASAFARSAAAETSPLDMLLGSWGGSGMVHLGQGQRERIKCNAYYRGGGAELRLAILCASASYKIEIRSTLAYDDGRLRGNWEERTFNASGDASGTARDGSIDVSISGGVSGKMHVSFTERRQSVSISMHGSALQGVQMELARG